jgi:hypothetical protein
MFNRLGPYEVKAGARDHHELSQLLDDLHLVLKKRKGPGGVWLSWTGACLLRAWGSPKRGPARPAWGRGRSSPARAWTASKDACIARCRTRAGEPGPARRVSKRQAAKPQAASRQASAFAQRAREHGARAAGPRAMHRMRMAIPAPKGRTATPWPAQPPWRRNQGARRRRGRVTQLAVHGSEPRGWARYGAPSHACAARAGSRRRRAGGCGGGGACARVYRAAPGPWSGPWLARPSATSPLRPTRPGQWRNLAMPAVWAMAVCVPIGATWPLPIGAACTVLPAVGRAHRASPNLAGTPPTVSRAWDTITQPRHAAIFRSAPVARKEVASRDCAGCSEGSRVETPTVDPHR